MEIFSLLCCCFVWSMPSGSQHERAWGRAKTLSVGAVCEAPLPSLMREVVLLLLLRWPSLLPLLSQTSLLPLPSLLMLWCVLLLEVGCDRPTLDL